MSKTEHTEDAFDNLSGVVEYVISLAIIVCAEQRFNKDKITVGSSYQDTPPYTKVIRFHRSILCVCQLNDDSLVVAYIDGAKVDLIDECSIKRKLALRMNRCIELLSG